MIGVVVQRTDEGGLDVVRGCLAMFDDRCRNVRFADAAWSGERRRPFGVMIASLGGTPS